ncbi:phospholipase [Mammaliicoccus fleurettii]|nr:phospholipase [Mammaliicoccus fleurettii]
MGERDPIVTKEQSERVIQIFKERNATVSETWVNSHELTQEAVLAAREIL